MMESVKRLDAFAASHVESHRTVGPRRDVRSPLGGIERDGIVCSQQERPSRAVVLKEGRGVTEYVEHFVLHCGYLCTVPGMRLCTAGLHHGGAAGKAQC